jgi:hypothetical protein
VADAGAAVVAAEDDVAVGAEYINQSLEEGGADGAFVVGWLGLGDAIAGEFGDEEGDVGFEEGGEVAPSGRVLVGGGVAGRRETCS